MPMYHLLFKGRPEKPVRSVSFYGENPADALELAKRQDGPAEFWIDSEFICTLTRSGANGEIWVISAERADAGNESVVHAPLETDIPTALRA